jgi:hypothetical protein
MKRPVLLGFFHTSDFPFSGAYSDSSWSLPLTASVLPIHDGRGHIVLVAHFLAFPHRVKAILLDRYPTSTPISLEKRPGGFATLLGRQSLPLLLESRQFGRYLRPRPSVSDEGQLGPVLPCNPDAKQGEGGGEEKADARSTRSVRLV